MRFLNRELPFADRPTVELEGTFVVLRRTPDELGREVLWDKIPYDRLLNPHVFVGLVRELSKREGSD